MIIPPTNPNEKDFSTCENCRARDAASKKRKCDGNVAKEPGPGPVMGNQDASLSVAGRAGEDADIEVGDDLIEVSTHSYEKKLILTGHIRPLQCIPTVDSYLMHYRRLSKRKNKSIFSVPIVYQKILWSVIVRGLG
jgi:hypothetical protein